MHGNREAMTDDVYNTLILERRIEPARLRDLVSKGFGDMVK